MDRAWFFPVPLLILLFARGHSKENMLPVPRNLHFSSLNLQNVLHWELPARRTAGKQQFSVQYKVYGEKDWKIKAECQNITKTYCDLSNETDYYKEHYYARVRSVSEAGLSNWIKSGRFNPEMETIFTSPKVKLEAGVCSITIILTPPKKWQYNLHQSIPLTKMFHELKFEILVIDEKINKSCTYLENGDFKKVDTLEHDTTYCVTVRSVEHSSLRRSDPSKNQCIKTPKDPAKQMVQIILFGCVLPVLLFIFIFALACCFMYKYVNARDQKQPINLLQNDCPSNQTFLICSPELLAINVVILEKRDKEASSYGCKDADDCKIPLTSQVCNMSATEWKAIPLTIENVYKSQIVENPATENRVYSERGVPVADQSKQNGPSTVNEGIHHGDIATENISLPQQLQSIQLPNGNYRKPLQLGYRSQLLSGPVNVEGAQYRPDYGLLEVETRLNPQNERPRLSPDRKTDDPLQTSYLSQSVTNDSNTRATGSNDGQRERAYLPKMPQQQEQSNYTSQVQLAGKPPMNGVDCCPLVLHSKMLNEKLYEEMEEADLDWDLSSGRLSLSALCIRRDSEDRDSLTQTIEPQQDLLSSVCTKAFPDESLKTEEEAYLSNFQEHWGLRLQI